MGLLRPSVEVAVRVEGECVLQAEDEYCNHMRSMNANESIRARWSNTVLFYSIGQKKSLRTFLGRKTTKIVHVSHNSILYHSNLKITTLRWFLSSRGIKYCMKLLTSVIMYYFRLICVKKYRFMILLLWWHWFTNSIVYLTRSVKARFARRIVVQSNLTCPFQIDQSQSLEVTISSPSLFCIG